MSGYGNHLCIKLKYWKLKIVYVLKIRLNIDCNLQYYHHKLIELSNLTKISNKIVATYCKVIHKIIILIN
jgi:hypothetical protein